MSNGIEARAARFPSASRSPVAVSDQAAYSGDYTNFRVVMVKLAYSVEKSAPIGR